MNTNAARLAKQIISDAEMKLGMIPCESKLVMINTYTEAISEVKKGGIFFANIYDETTKKRFTRGYEVA